MTGQIRLAQHGGYIFIVRTVMTPTQVDLVRESFHKIASRVVEASRLFYDEFFRLAPHRRAMFPSDLSRQQHKFAQMLSEVVKNLDRVGAISEEIVDLGHRHLAYDVERADYEIFGEALLSMLEKLLGPRMTPEMLDAWAAAYDMLTRFMLEASETARSPQSFYSRIIRDVMVAQYGLAFGNEIKGGKASISRDIDSSKVIRLS